MQPLKIVAFAGASNLPFWVGQERGLFRREGVEPSLEITPNSVEMAKALYDGRYDLALTSVDNIVAYDEGQGEAQLAGPADFVALFSVDNGMLSVMAAPGIGSLADLKGRIVSVDAMTTGFAFVLREMLAGNGLAEGDVTFVRVGGGAQRLAALLQGDQAATLLNTPLDLVAEAKGFRRLARARDMLGAYQGIVAATRRGTVDRLRAPLAGFTRGFHAAIAWLADDANRDEAVALLTRRIPGMERPLAERAYAALLDPSEGLYRDLRLDGEGLRTVLRLRSAYARPQKDLTDPARYIDATFLEDALKG
jgi:ABC-type nitrate/sulfonate/bicarbonate transport system substrate-binding protein